MKKEITFDSFVRGLLVVIGLVAAYFVIRRLHGALLPFFIAWLLAYLIYPIVTFFQYKLHFHFRLLSIVVTLVLVFAVAAGLVAFIVPPTLREFAHLRTDIVGLVQSVGQSPLANEIERYMRENFDENAIAKLFQNKDVMELLQLGAGQVWSVITNAFSLFRGIVSAMLMLLYLFFILMDYEAISEGFIRLFPARHRAMGTRVFDDVKRGMQAYFRGQALIALIVGIMFSIGFSIVGLPMAIGLGMFIGLLNLVPYLQVVGILPTLLLAFLRSTQTGENFWLIVLYCFIVFLIVQGTQDIILTPKIMGKMMGLKPAIILLSLSVWGTLLGFIGLIIALPLTTLCISYYRLIVLKEDPRLEKAEASDDTQLEMGD